MRVTLRSACAILAGVAVLGGAAARGARADEPGGPRPTAARSTADAASEPVPAPVIRVAVRQGLVTLEVRDAPLDDVLRALAAEAGFRLSLHGALDAATTRSFRDVPLQRAIERLARGHSLGFEYGGDPDGISSSLVQLWVIESGPARGSTRSVAVGTPASAATPAAVQPLAGVLANAPDARARARAARALARMRGPEAARALRLGVGDADPAVRVSALRGLARADPKAAAELIGHLLLTDPDLMVRRVAALTLATLSSPAARSALAAATADANELVRRTAASALARWERRHR